MPEYMLLLYAPEAVEASKAELMREELPLWTEVTESLREAGLLISNAPLRPVATATSVRVREGEVELTDGPFAMTKEVLAGYYLLSCADLDDSSTLRDCRWRAMGPSRCGRSWTSARSWSPTGRRPGRERPRAGAGARR